MTVKKYFVYSKPNCPYCDQAKALLEQKQLPFEVIMLDVGQPKVEGMKYASREDILAIFPNARTMPQINVAWTEPDGTNISGYVGGFTELKARLA